MNAPTLAAPKLGVAARSQRTAFTILSLGLLGLGLLFNAEVTAAVHIWMASTAYNHCFLVVPIAAYLIWDRRAVLRGLTPAPLPAAALAGLPVGLVWLLSERLGIMEGRQLALMTFVELLFLVVLGWRFFRAFAGPLLYLYFLVPFGEFLVPKLQDVTTLFTVWGLALLHIPFYSDGYNIDIPEGSFVIAEACAGLRFLIASVAFGCLYALLMYRSPLRRILFIAVSLVVPIVANGFRAVGIIALGHYLGSAEAAATDHVLYGWIFFSLVILLLTALGLPFRQDNEQHRSARIQESVTWTRFGGRRARRRGRRGGGGGHRAGHCGATQSHGGQRATGRAAGAASRKQLYRATLTCPRRRHAAGRAPLLRRGPGHIGSRIVQSTHHIGARAGRVSSPRQPRRRRGRCGVLAADPQSGVTNLAAGHDGRASARRGGVAVG